jgi:peptidoglycan/LPS O-acetylase OafA/YrhL
MKAEKIVDTEWLQGARSHAQQQRAENTAPGRRGAVSLSVSQAVGTVNRISLASTLSGKHLPGLDGLRAIAVFTVIVYHFGFGSVPGDLGVTGFFVLSGFLITWLLLKEMARDGSVSFRAFCVRRTLRIVPAYYVFVMLSLLADSVLGAPWTGGTIVAAFGYFINYYSAFTGGANQTIAHAWSLGVEEQFYLVWPVLFLLLAHRGRKALLYGLVTLITLVLLWRTWLLVGGTSIAHLYHSFDTRFDSLAIGCLLAVVAEKRTFASVARFVGSYAWQPVVTLLLLYVSRSLTPSAYHYSVGFTVDSLLIAVLIIQMLQLHSSAAWRWLEIPAIRYLGRISYPLYLWHGWAFAVAKRVELPFLVQFVLAVIVAVGLASGSYYIIERPFLALKPIIEKRVRSRKRFTLDTPINGPVIAVA